MYDSYVRVGLAAQEYGGGGGGSVAIIGLTDQEKYFGAADEDTASDSP